MSAPDITIDQRQRIVYVRIVQFARLVMNEVVWAPEGKVGVSDPIRRAAEDHTRTALDHLCRAKSSEFRMLGATQVLPCPAQ